MDLYSADVREKRKIRRNIKRSDRKRIQWKIDKDKNVIDVEYEFEEIRTKCGHELKVRYTMNVSEASEREERREM